VPDDLRAVSAARWRHAVYGLVVESDFALDGLPTLRDDSVRADVRLARVPAGYFSSHDAQPMPGSWYRHQSLSNGAVYLTVPGVLQAEIEGGGRTALCAPMPDADPRAFAANVLNFVLAVALTLQGEEPLHGTAVRLQNRAIGLLGESGTGKSTLAAYLLADGGALVTDDMLRIGFVTGEAMAYPGPARLKLFDAQARRLLPEAARSAAFNPLSGKLLVQAGSPMDEDPVPLAALFWLGEPAPPAGASVTVRRVQGAEAIGILLSATLHRDHRPAHRMERQLHDIQRIARSVAVFAVGYARRHEVLPEVAAVLRRCM
jgi:hypothetical protein